MPASSTPPLAATEPWPARLLVDVAPGSSESTVDSPRVPAPTLACHARRHPPVRFRDNTSSSLPLDRPSSVSVLHTLVATHARPSRTVRRMACLGKSPSPTLHARIHLRWPAGRPPAYIQRRLEADLFPLPQAARRRLLRLLPTSRRWPGQKWWAGCPDTPSCPYAGRMRRMHTALRYAVAAPNGTIAMSETIIAALDLWRADALHSRECGVPLPVCCHYLPSRSPCFARARPFASASDGDGPSSHLRAAASLTCIPRPAATSPPTASAHAHCLSIRLVVMQTRPSVEQATSRASRARARARKPRESGNFPELLAHVRHVLSDSKRDITYALMILVAMSPTLLV